MGISPERKIHRNLVNLLAKTVKGLKVLIPYLKEEYGEEKTKKVLEYAEARNVELCRENEGDNKAVKSHTELDVYPMISVYEGLQKNGVSKEAAQKFLDVTFSKKAEPGAAQMRMLLKIPGAYKLVPKLFKSVTESQFGEDAGFHATFLEASKTRIRFDMEKCLYWDRFCKYGYPELTMCMCHTDDVNNGAMHPKLCWARTKTMGEGGDVCDFHMYIKK